MNEEETHEPFTSNKIKMSLLQGVNIKWIVILLDKEA